MGAVLKIIDEHFGKQPARQTVMELKLVSERITARDLIRKRIAEEIRRLNTKLRAQDKERSLLIAVPAHPTEQALNKSATARTIAKLKPVQTLDLEQEVQKSINAFKANKFVMLFDDQQVEDLDANITIIPGSELVFLRLTPLIGG